MASWVSVHPRLPVVYSTNELSNGTLSAFRLNKATGDLTFLNKVDSLGASPTHLDIHPSGLYIAASNYDTGSTAMATINPIDGRLGSIVSLNQYNGSGPVPWRQWSAHPHQFLFHRLPSGKYTGYAPDLGSDLIRRTSFDIKTGKLTDLPAFHVHANGTGPRHMTFHPRLDVAYVLYELSNEVSVHKVNKATGDLSPAVTVLSVLIPNAPTSNPNNAAEIILSPNNKFLYASQRGQDTITSFSVSKDGLDIAVKSVYRCQQAKLPRHFAFVGKGHMIIGSQNGTTSGIEIATVNHKTGKIDFESFVGGVGKPVTSLVPY
ncbi:hypothetical protein HDV00_006798 [Rhizophlyctis rosea]|nr:hypothetical protein HDV00_006798 [Rhizophlyctis rosea]